MLTQKKHALSVIVHLIVSERWSDPFSHWTLHLAAMGTILGRISEEVPQHTVLVDKQTYQVRRYAPQVAAIYAGESSKAFMELAGYYGIMSGPKQEAETPIKISMTAPVVMDFASDTFDSPNDSEQDQRGGQWGSAAIKEMPMHAMTFLLPAKFKSAAVTPKPSNSNIRLVDLPERTTAVIKFSGNLSVQILREKTAMLRKALSDDGISYADEKPKVACYNPPFAIPFLKTNEIQIDVDSSTLPST